jgi:hypothetical protein
MKVHTFRIDCEIPLTNRRSRCWRYPFDLMDVGMSFPIRGLRNRNRVHTAMLGYMKNHPDYRFVIRRERKSTEPRGARYLARRWRCWRVAAEMVDGPAS